MKRTWILISLVAIVALFFGGQALLRTRSVLPTELAPAWLLTAEGRYGAVSMTDPFASWSPDSKSLLFAVYTMKQRQEKIFRWEVDAKRIEPITEGWAPNYVTNDEFLYMRRDPKSILQRSLSTGKEREAAPALKTSDFWKEVTAFTYEPTKQSVILRLIESTRYSTPGTEEYSLAGEHLGEVESLTSEGVMDSSTEPGGSKVALLVQERENGPLSVQIADKGQSRGRQIASGSISAVAWSPNRKIVAYGQGAVVVAADVASGKRTIIARFSDSQKPADARYVSRLLWSPDGEHLAVQVYVPRVEGDYPLIYVLDTGGLGPAKQ